MAYTGESPALGSVLLRSIWWIFSHAFFFLPRRKVQIEIVDMTDELIRAAILGLDHFNTTLEDFYNAPGLEAVQYIRHSLIGDDVGSKTLPDRIVGSLEDIATGGGTLSETLDPLVVEEIIGYLISIFPGMLFTADTHLLLDTHLDSLQMAELKEYISATFPIASNPPISELRRVSDLVRMAMGILHATTSFKEAHWQEISGDIPLRLLGHSGDSIARRIIAHLQTERSHDMLYDPEHGVLTRKDIALKVQVLRSVLASLPGERVALLLPSLTATTVLLAATYLAGKTPVMLNWTVGEVNFRHCFEISGATKIVTSRAFLRKANIRFIE